VPGTKWQAALVTAVVIALQATAATASSAATPNPATMTLQVADLATAKSVSAGSVKEQGYQAAYQRTLLLNSPYGASHLVIVQSEVAVAATADTPTKDLASAQAGFRSKAGRKAIAADAAKGFKVKPSAVSFGKMRGVAGLDAGFEQPLSIKTKKSRVYESFAFLRLDRTLVVLYEVGVRPTAPADTRKLAGLIAGHITTALTPVNTAPPTVTGTPQQGQTLTAAPGTWTADDAAFTYQWQHCDATGANCTDVAGATQPTYAVTAADVGFTLRVNVTATNRFGAPVASSTPTAAAT
jgi:hypothetical protein